MTETDDNIPIWQHFKPGDEVKDPIKLEVSGTIPDWVEGSLYRNGSGVFEIGGSKMNHLFDGMSVLIRFIIKDGEVSFQSKILDSDAWNASYKANRLVVDQFATRVVPDPCKNIFSRFFTMFKQKEPNNNTNVSIIERGDEMWALNETTLMNRVDAESLSLTQSLDISNYVAVHLATAHPHVQADGVIYNLGTRLKSSTAYNIIKIPPQTNGNLYFDKAELVASAPSRWWNRIGYSHSFGMSENYFIILEQPYGPDLIKIVKKQLSSKMVTRDCFVFDSDEKALFHVIQKDGRRIAVKYFTESMFVFHFVNCYEQDGQLVIDCVGYKDLETMLKLNLTDIRSWRCVTLNSEPNFLRFVVPLDISNAKKEENMITLDTKATAILQNDGSIFCTPDRIVEGGVIMELPQINYKNNNGKDYQYVYGSTIFSTKNEIVKLDIKNKTVIRREMEDTNLNGEPIFLAKPGATKEDEGVLLAPVIGNTVGAASYLAIFDAETMTELARAVAPVDKVLPFTYHGCFTNNTLGW